MKPSRLFFTTIMTFWVLFLSLLALVATYAPQGGVDLAGLTLFANGGLTDATNVAMIAIGLSETARSIVFGLLGGLNFGAAGLVLFAMMFCVLGEAAERRDAQPLAEGAAICAAVASGLTMLIGLAGGLAGALMYLELAAFIGLITVVVATGHVNQVEAETGPVREALLDDVIADHAATHAAFSAQLASLSRREQHT